MTDKKQALTDLLAKVEAGGATKRSLKKSCLEVFGIGACWGLCFDAYNGSLDAAQSLHEAVLPEWQWYRQGFVMYVTDDHTGWGSKPHFSARDDTNPARAWLIAIIKALIAEETK